MKSVNNKVLFSAVKKFLAVLISFNFLFSLQVLAGTPQRIKSRDEIKVMLTSSDKYIKTAGIKNTLAWSLVVVAVGRMAYSFGKTDKSFKEFQDGIDLGKKTAISELESAFKKEKRQIDAEAFNRGFSAGQESMDAKLNQLYKGGKKLGYSQGFEQGFKQGYGNRIIGLAPDMSKGQHKAILTKAEKAALENFERQVKYLEVKLATPTGIDFAKRKVATLIIKASNQANALKVASNPQEIAVARNELLTTVERMAETKMPDTATREVVKEYTKELTSLLRGKGGVIGVSAAAVIAAGAMLVCSQEAQSANISNTRLLVERELSRALKQTPELFAVKVLSLKDTYGLDVVSSVLYEHQESIPVLQQQLGFFQSAQIRRVAAQAVKSFGWSSYSPKENKQNLLNSFRG